MSSIQNILKQSGLTSIEYAIIAGLLSIGLVGGFYPLGVNAINSINELAQSIPKKTTESGSSGSSSSGSGSSGSSSSDSGSSSSDSSDSGSSGAEGSDQATSQPMLTANLYNMESSDISNAGSIRRDTIASVQQAKSKATTTTGSVSNNAQKNIPTWKWLLLTILILAGTWIFNRIFSKKGKQ